MKLVSWNVNGIRAAWGRGLAALLNVREADIYAIQEVRCDQPFTAAEIDGYYPYWSLYTKRRGYSGVLCLTRTKPLRVWRTLRHPDADLLDEDGQTIDFEGRVLTLEYKDFYLINVYVPSLHSKPERKEYRAEWDIRFSTYVGFLKHDKSVIICGDLNATVDERDVHKDNTIIPGADADFITTERENLRNLLNGGFIDCFREMHPDTNDAYSWWSYKRNDRVANRGWRLDYALVSDDLREKIIDCELLSEIYGSDHCPLRLTLDKDFSFRKEPAIILDSPTNVPRLRHVLPEVSGYKWTELAIMWDSVDWKGAARNVAKMQADLATAAMARDYREIERCQNAIMQSRDARLLAVREACDSSGGPGVDGVVWAKPHEKMLAALSLDPDRYIAMCDRLTMIRTKNGKEHRIHISSYHDSAMEALCAMALDPVAESWADRKSFAYRKWRTMPDMAHYVRLMFTRYPYFRNDGSPVYDSDPPEWAIIADVHQCYESISQEWLKSNIPMNKHVLEEFLSAGYLFNGELFPSKDGVGVGRRISPIIANMSLDGLQRYLIRRMFPGSQIPDYAGCNLVRYCDDIIVACRSSQDAQEIQGYISEFLMPRGLELSRTKSRIVNITQGFDFMGRHYEKLDGIVHMTPSEAAVKEFEASLEEVVYNHNGSHKSLIVKINRKLDGWATYHKTEEATKAFAEIDDHLTAILLRLCRKMHPHWSVDRILDQYWYKRADGQRIFSLPDDRTTRVRLLRDVVPGDHVYPKLSLNPYLHREVLKAQSDDRSIHNAVGKHRAQWISQGGRCWRCGLPIMRDQRRMLEEVDGARPGKGRFFAYVHPACQARSIDIIETDTVPETAAETRELLEAFYRETRLPAQRYLPLSAYFRESRKQEIVLSFEEIEKILKQPLPAQASFPEYWEETGFGKISLCWLEHGYDLQKLDLRARKAKFRRVFRNTSNINIPDTFLYSRVPAQVKYEVERFLQDIQTKYGL